MKKITSVGEYVIAGSGPSRYCDSIQYGWEPPEYDGSDPYTFMVKTFIPAMKAAHDECGYTLKENEAFSFIVGLQYQLFLICEDYSVIQTSNGIYISGSGGELALGAFRASNDIRKALAIAIEFDINSGGDVHLVERNINGKATNDS